MGCLSWLRDLFGLGNKPVGPAGSNCLDFDGIDPSDIETKNLARLISMTHPRGTEERWKEVERQLRKDLCEKEENWEEKKALSAKGLLTRTRKVYECRKAHVEIPPPELAKLIKFFDILTKGTEAVSEEAGEEHVPEADENPAEKPVFTIKTDDDAVPAAEKPVETSETTESTPGTSGQPAKTVKIRDYGHEAMKQLSLEQRALLELREDGFEYGEVLPEAFFNLLYKLKYIHGHMWPPPNQKKTTDAAGEAEATTSEGTSRASSKKKKGKNGKGSDESKVVVDSFMDLGCGAGKAVFCAALFFEFASCSGIEMISALHDVANELKGRWQEEVQPSVTGKKALDTLIEFENNDLRHSKDWHKGSFLYLNAPTLTEHTLEQLATKANGKAVRPETIAVVVAKPWKALNKDKWILIAEDSLRCTWGATKVFVYEKLPEGGSKPFPQQATAVGSGQESLNDGSNKKKKKKKKKK